MKEFSDIIEQPNVKPIIGVYGIFNTATDEWEYVGQSKNIYNRLLSHIMSTFKNVYDLEFYIFYEFDSYDLKSMLYYETLLINELNPKMNAIQQQWFLKNEHVEIHFINKNITKEFLRWLSQLMMYSQRFQINQHKVAVSKNKELTKENRELKTILKKHRIKYKKNEDSKMYKTYENTSRTMNPIYIIK